MTHKELSELILEWTKNRNEPFMTADAFNDIDAAESANDTSQAIALLFRKGLLARKKIDGVRFSYALPESAPEGYETTTGIKPDSDETESAINETKHAINETKRMLDQSKQPLYAPMPVEKAKQKTGMKIQEIKVPETVKLPESFTLRLETPGGITITITTGA